jgi:hypothetical protein
MAAGSRRDGITDARVIAGDELSPVRRANRGDANRVVFIVQQLDSFAMGERTELVAR